MLGVNKQKSFVSKDFGLKVSSRSRSDLPSLDLGRENFFKSRSQILVSIFFKAQSRPSGLDFITALQVSISRPTSVGY